MSRDNVFRVCDQPHPVAVAAIVKCCQEQKLDEAYDRLTALCNQGYSALDMVTTLFRVLRNYDLPEFLKLEFIRECGMTHVRVGDGVNSRLQLPGLLARMVKASAKASGARK